MEKKKKFMAWLSAEIENPLNTNIRHELQLLWEKCDSDMWEIHIRQRDIDNMTELHIYQKFSGEGARARPGADRMVATTKAMRKLRELEAAQ